VLDVSIGFFGFSIPSSSALAGEGYLAPYIEALKREVNVPVILTGSIKDTRVADQLVREGKADSIGVGRAIAADSYWAKKAMEMLQDWPDMRSVV
jgi:2,4-dienoyl-CoA reductase-like NADH-dependent reductase (Old Yellow Enzyme family)